MGRAGPSQDNRPLYVRYAHHGAVCASLLAFVLTLLTVDTLLALLSFVPVSVMVASQFFFRSHCRCAHLCAAVFMTGVAIMCSVFCAAAYCDEYLSPTTNSSSGGNNNNPNNNSMAQNNNNNLSVVALSCEMRRICSAVAGVLWMAGASLTLLLSYATIQDVVAQQEQPRECPSSSHTLATAAPTAVPSESAMAATATTTTSQRHRLRAPQPPPDPISCRVSLSSTVRPVGGAVLSQESLSPLSSFSTDPSSTSSSSEQQQQQQQQQQQEQLFTRTVTALPDGSIEMREERVHPAGHKTITITRQQQLEEV